MTTPAPAVSVAVTTAATLEEEAKLELSGLLGDIPVIGQNVLVIVLILFGLLVASGTRDQWGPPIYNATLGKIHCCSCRNGYCCGYCWAWCAFCLCCCSDKWGQHHPNFRLRILVHEARSLRKTDMFGNMQVFVRVRCGNNPDKTTSVQLMPVGLPVLGGNKNNVIWNEPIDLEVATVDETIFIECCDQDGMSESVIGKAALQVSEFWPQMAKVDEATMKIWRMKDGSVEKRLLYGGNKDAGQMILSLFATNSGQPLPPVMLSAAPQMGME